MKYVRTKKASSLLKLGIHAVMLTALTAVCVTAIGAQIVTRTVTGRVVDDNGIPMSNVYVMLTPIADAMAESVITDLNGRFSISVGYIGKTLYLYVWKENANVERRTSLLYPPFYPLAIANKKFIGRPIVFVGKRNIDVGDVHSQFSFVQVDLRLTRAGKSLDVEEWKTLWLRLRDESGRIFMEQSVAGVSGNMPEVDLSLSVLKLTLPEGRWKIDFQTFDIDKVTVQPRVLGKTPYFEAKRMGDPMQIAVSIK